jgi:hypothetical protein
MRVKVADFAVGMMGESEPKGHILTEMVAFPGEEAESGSMLCRSNGDTSSVSLQRNVRSTLL